MKQVSNTKILACFLFSALLGGCAHNTFIPYESFEGIEIRVLDSKTETYTGTGPSRSETVATGAAAGAFGGLAASFLTSLACGPYFAVCFAAFAPTTIGATTLVGGAMGMSALSDEDAAKITTKLDALKDSHNLNQELATALSQKLPASSLVPPEVADARISLDINKLELAQVFGKKNLLSLTVVTQYEWGLNEPGSRHSTRILRCNSRSWPFNEWMNGNGFTLEQELEYCIEDLASQINKILTKPPPTSVDEFPELDV